MATSVKRNFICGVLHLSSKLSYESDGKLMKPFTPFEKYNSDGNEYKEFIVSTKKQYNSRDIYAVIKFTGIRKKDKVAVGSVEQYLGEVGDLAAEKEYLKLACVMTWTKDRSFINYFEDLYHLERNNLEDDKELNIFSIDPLGCTDIDDAIHIRYKLNKDGVQEGYDIGIHIADVSCYIPTGSPLDEELSYRAESVYLRDNQVNMIPPKLVTTYSLTANTPKKVYSVHIDLDNNLKINCVSFQRNSIIVKKNLSYDEAKKKIEEGHSTLKLMYEIGKKLHIILGLNKNGYYDTHTMVEAYMVLANTLVAQQISKKNPKNVLLRRHTGSRKETYKLDESVSHEIIKRANILLMNKAEYCLGYSDDAKHVGLGCDVYTHFTSPIRRYADILVHRMLSNSDYKTNEKIIFHINKIHSKYNKCERLDDLLEKIFSLKKQYGDVFEMEGYIIDIVLKLKKTIVKIYIEAADLIVDSNIFTEKLSHLVKCSLDKLSDREEITIEGIKNKVSLSMFQKVKVKIAMMVNTRQKIVVRVINPNVQCVFDTIDLNDNLFIDPWGSDSD